MTSACSSQCLYFAITSKACYTLFANNDETRTKLQNKDVQWIVYSRRSTCFANRFFAVCCLQDLHQGSGLFDEHKGVFRWKKEICPLAPVVNMFAYKLMVNNEQCLAAYSTCFRICSVKRGFYSLFVLFTNSV